MIAALLALFFSFPVSAQTPGPNDQVISVEDFTQCGYVSRFSPNKIKPECFQSLDNAVLDQDYSILRRNGYSLYNQTGCQGLKSIRGMWPFYGTDGSQYIVVQSSQSMFYSKGDGTCNPIVGLSGLDSVAQMSCVQGLGYLWCTDGIDPVFQTNITSTATVTQAPLGKYIGFFRNRIIIGGVSANLTSVYLSGELNGSDFTLPAVQMSTSSAILKLNGVNDGLAISCLLGEYQNGFYIGRNYDTWLLSGYSLADFVISRVDQQIGCMDNNSSRMVNNTLMWLSHRGVEQFTGTQINWVSYPIDPDIAVVISAAGNSQAFTINGNNFTTGNLTASGSGAPISSTIFPGNLTVSSNTFSNTTTAQFNIGSFSHTTAYVSSNSQELSISTGSPFPNAGFEFGSFLNWTNSNFSTQPIAAIDSLDRVNVACTGSCIQTGAGATIVGTTSRMPGVLEVHDASGGSILFSSTTYNTAGSPVPYPINVNTSSMGSSQIYIKAYSLDYSSYSLQSSTFPNWSDGFTYGWSGSCTASKCNLVFDVSESTYGAGYSSGTYISSIFNTGFSTPIATLSITSSPVSGATTVFSIRSSTSPNNDLWSLWKTPGTNPQSQYIQYGATFTATISSQNPVVPSVVLYAETTGYYITPCVNTAGSSSYGVFTVDAVNNGGSFTFWTSTGPSCNYVIVATAPWQLQTANAVISNSTAGFIASRVLFSVDQATQTPILNDIAFNWNAGASRPPVASAQYLNRYYLFYTTSQVSGAGNDHTFVYDQNSHWQYYDDIRAASSALYLNKLYLGDSQSTGDIYLFDSGPSDNGGAFTFSFTTPDFDGGDALSLKQFERAYMLVGAPTTTSLTSSMNCSYAIDGSTTAYSLGTVNWTEAPATNGYWMAKMPFPSSPPTTGHWVNLSCSNTGTQGPLKFYGYKIVYTKTDWP